MQIALRGVTETDAGALGRILAADGVEVIGWRVFDAGGDTRVVVALPDAARAGLLLRKALVEFSATPVVVARLGEPSVKYHLLMELTRAGIQVSWFYALAPLERPALAVFKTDDDGRALRVIRESPWECSDAGGAACDSDEAAEGPGCVERSVAA